MIDKLKAYAWQIAAAVLLAACITQTVRLAGEETAHAKTQASIAREREDAATARAEAVSEARKEEQRRTNAVQKVADETSKKLDVARADAVNARAAGQRLRQQITAVAKARAAACNPGAASGGAATDATGDLLERVQQRLDEAADGIAGYADEAAAAGKSCERSWDALESR